MLKIKGPHITIQINEDFIFRKHTFSINWHCPGDIWIVDHNMKILTLSLLLMAQSVLLLINIKTFRKIWGK